MSDNNKDNLDNQDQNQGGGGGQNKGLLGYHFLPYEGGSVFQIFHQHPAVERFLEQQPGGYFQATNGLIVTTGILHPEWKESKNVIFLDGTGGVRQAHIDITYFQTVWDSYNVVRDNKMHMFKSALEELITAIQHAFSEELKFDPLRRDKRQVRVMLG